jgi:replicative DNA helicase
MARRSEPSGFRRKSGGGAQTAADQFPGKMPPQNQEAEQGVLGSILLENEAIDEVADFLHPTHFYNDANQQIYATALRLHESGVRIDPVILVDELKKEDVLEDVGGPPYIHQVLETVPHAAHAKFYAQIVRDKWIQRSLTYACNEILRECYEGARDTDGILETAEQRIFSILEQQENVVKIAIADILMDAFDRIHQRMETDGAISGLGTGFTDLDSQLNGFQPSELIILAARPSMGKTALVCNIAEAAASEYNAGVLIFSLEQSKLELAERLLCIRAGVNGHHVRAGELTDDERDQLMQASSELSEVPLFIDDQPGRSMAQIGAIARRLRRRNQLGMVIIDYLQLIEPEDKQAPREQQIAQITRRLKFMAKELNIPVIALAQLNRGVELREDKRPRLADLRESGAIEQDADVVMFLHRPEQYDPEDRPGEAELIVAKNRSGPTGMVRLTWLKESMKFADFSNLSLPEGGYGFGNDGGSF